MVTNILDALEKADPGRRAAYASNALSYIQRLEQLHQEIAAGLGLAALAAALVIAALG